MSPANDEPVPNDIFLVFQMAKVASRSWSNLLHRDFPHALVSHFHAISNKRVGQIEQLMAAQPSVQTIKHMTLPRLGRPQDEITGFVSDGRWVGPKATVVTGVRDPVARAISAVGFLCNRLGYKPLPVTPRDGGTAENIIEVFHRALAVARGHDTGEDTMISLLAGIIGDFDLWFNEELYSAFDLDITTTDFDREARMLSVSGTHKVLVYRMEDLTDRVACTRLLDTASQFLGRKLGHFPGSNTSNEARYQSLYRQVTQSLRLPQDMLDWFYNNPTVTRFYTDEEIASFRARWA